MENLKVALIGDTGLGLGLLLNSLRDLPARLCAICVRDERAYPWADFYKYGRNYTDYNEMLNAEHPDLVILYDEQLPMNEVAADCLRAGAYVFAERPVCESSVQADILAQLQQETGRYVMPRWNRRCSPSYMMAKEIIQRAEFGSPNMFMAKFQSGRYASDHLMLWHHISHFLDVARMLLGEIKITHADKRIIKEGMYCYNISFVSEMGCIGVFQSGSTQCGEYPTERVEVAGIDCNVVIDNVRGLEYNRKAYGRKDAEFHPLADGGDTLIWNPNGMQLSGFSFTCSGLEGCLKNIVQAVQSKGRPLFDMEDTVKTIALLEEVERVVRCHD